MGNIHLTGSFVFLWLCLPSLGHCQVTLFEVEKFPAEPVKNGNVTLTCLATEFDPNAHLFSWKRFYNSTNIINVTLNERSSVNPSNLTADLIVKLYSQSLTITNLTKSDEGLYLCEIITKVNGTIIVNGQVSFTVNATQEFPVCFPDGPAVVNEGDILTCRTVIDERTPVVSDTDNPTQRIDWVNTPLAVNDSGSRWHKIVKISDDTVTFFCFSITPDNQNLTSLSCKIGPLTVIPLTASTTPRLPQILPTGEPALPIAAIIGIAVGAFLLLLLLLLLIHTICCRYKPKSYLLNFGGFFGSTIRRRQSRDPNQTELELDRQIPDGSDEPYPAQDDQVRFSFDDGGNPSVLPIVKIEPNIYEKQMIPGTSFQRETDPEEDAYWNEDLKQQLADAVSDDDNLSD